VHDVPDRLAYVADTVRGLVYGLVKMHVNRAEYTNSVRLLDK